MVEAVEETAPVGFYRVLKRATVREEFELSSHAIFAIDAGGLVNVLETRTTESGQVRLRFERGWTSLTSRKDGTQLLQFVGGEQEGQEEQEGLSQEHETEDSHARDEHREEEGQPATDATAEPAGTTSPNRAIFHCRIRPPPRPAAWP